MHDRSDEEIEVDAASGVAFRLVELPHTHGAPDASIVWAKRERTGHMPPTHLSIVGERFGSSERPHVCVYDVVKDYFQPM